MKAILVSFVAAMAFAGCASTPAEAPMSERTGNCANVAWADNPDGKPSRSAPPPGFTPEERARFGAFLIAPLCGAPKEAVTVPLYWPEGKKASEVGKPDCLTANPKFFGGQRICWVIRSTGA